MADSKWWQKSGKTARATRGACAVASIATDNTEIKPDIHENVDKGSACNESPAVMK